MKSVTPNPLKGWQVDRASIRIIGHDLQRPECILAERDGTLWAADARGGVMRIAPNGSQQLVTPYVENLSTEQTSFENRYVEAQGSLPNGLAFAKNGDFIIANWGTDAVERMTREGHLHTLYTELDGQPLGKANFVLRDSQNRTRLTVTALTLTPEVMAATSGPIAPWMASLTFGRPDLQTVYLGSLRGTTLPFFRSPVAGLPMQHWQ